MIGEDQARHEVHDRRLARAVRPDQAGDARRDVQRDAVDAEHLAVELRDFVEDDCEPAPLHARSRGPRRSRLRRRRGHRTISTGRSLPFDHEHEQDHERRSATTDAPAPGPLGGSTPSSAHQTRLTDQAGSRTCPQVTRKTLSIIAATPLRMKKNARLTAPATILHFTYAELAIATRPRSSIHSRKPTTTPPQRPVHLEPRDAGQSHLQAEQDQARNPRDDRQHADDHREPRQRIAPPRERPAEVQRQCVVRQVRRIRPGPASAARNTANTDCTYMNTTKKVPFTWMNCRNPDRALQQVDVVREVDEAGAQERPDERQHREQEDLTLLIQLRQALRGSTMNRVRRPVSGPSYR